MGGQLLLRRGGRSVSGKLGGRGCYALVAAGMPDWTHTYPSQGPLGPQSQASAAPLLCCVASVALLYFPASQMLHG